MIAVAQAMTLNQCVLVYLPIRSCLLMSFSMKTRTRGRRMPFQDLGEDAEFYEGEVWDEDYGGSGEE